MDASGTISSETKPISRFLFDTVVLQPTSLCNLDCAYCYLPNRDQNRRMSREVAEAVASFLTALPRTPRPFKILWHCGEPLAAGIGRLGALFEPFAELERDRRVVHRLQTNGTLIDERWCAFFKSHSLSVGVSLDGPPWANRERVDWRGAASYDRALRGISVLRSAGIPFGVLAVVGEEALERGADLYHFFASLGCPRLGINTEYPGVDNQDRRLLDENERAGRFWFDLAREFLADGTLRLREFELFCDFWDAWDEKDLRRRPERDQVIRTRLYPTVGWDGDVVFLSPELLGSPAGHYGSFVVGNVTEEPLMRIAGRAKRALYSTDHLAGQDACRAQCEHFAFCGGGYAQHKFFTHGTMAATETAYCRMSRKRLFDVLATVMRTFPEGTEAASVLLPRLGPDRSVTKLQEVWA
jgi:uncharacterized protein